MIIEFSTSLMPKKVFQITHLRLLIRKTFSSICDVENTILTCPPRSILSLWAVNDVTGKDIYGNSIGKTLQKLTKGSLQLLSEMLSTEAFPVTSLTVMAIVTGYGFSSTGIQNLKAFSLQINIPKRSY